MSRGRTRLIGVPRPRAQAPEEAERARALRLLHEEAAATRREAEQDKTQKGPPNRSPKEAREAARPEAQEAGAAALPGPKRLPAEPKEAIASRPTPPAAKPPPKPSPSQDKPLRKKRPTPSKKKPAQRPPVRRPPLPVQPLPHTPLGAALEQFLLDRTIRQCAPMTLSGYRYDLGAFARFLGARGVDRPEDIAPQRIRLYLHDFHLRNLSAFTVNHHACTLRAFCNFLVAEEVIAKSPMTNIPMPRLPKRILPAFTVDEVRRLLDAAQTGMQPARDLALMLEGVAARMV